ncbi:MAG: IS30 family transposase [Flavobacteriaceae bacterium]|nr:IS30 family transposase [Flavobacteriaceae bacterium]
MSPISIDRQSRWYTKIQKLPSKEATPVAQAIIEIIHEIGPQLMKTMTFDNGLEFAKHDLIKQPFGIETYFTRSYSSQEKGTVENRIGVLRRWFTKGESIDDDTDQEIQIIEDKINNRGIRQLDYLSPIEKITSTWAHVVLDS